MYLRESLHDFTTGNQNQDLESRKRTPNLYTSELAIDVWLWSIPQIFQPSSNSFKVLLHNT